MNTCWNLNHNRLRAAAAFIAALALLLMFTGVRASQQASEGVDGVSEQPNLWLVKEGKHTGIIFRTADTQHTLPLAEAQHASGPLVMISWGDAAYYQTQKKSLALTLRALLLPTKAAVNAKTLESLSDAPQTRGKAKLYAMQLSDTKLARVLARIRYALVEPNSNAHGQLLTGQANDYVGGSFYAAADRKYSLLYTCNNWVADVLQAGGFRFSKLTSQFAGNLVVQHKAAWLLSPRHRRASDFKSIKVQTLPAQTQDS